MGRSKKLVNLVEDDQEKSDVEMINRAVDMAQEAQNQSEFISPWVDAKTMKRHRAVDMAEKFVVAAIGVHGKINSDFANNAVDAALNVLKLVDERS